MHSKKLRPGDFQPILSKIESAIDSRQAKHLSYPGRMQVIKSVLESVVGFWMHVLLFPKSVIRKIESLCRSYLWSGVTGKKRSLVAWKITCRALDCGGLGFNELLSWNKTLILKLAYDLDSDRTSILRLWANRNLLKGVSICGCSRVSGSSTLWKSILAVRDEFCLLFASSPPYTERLLNSAGRFDCGAAYKYFAIDYSTVPWCKLIWSIIQPRKWSSNCWIATRNRLPTKAQMHRWGGVDSDLCVLCGAAAETADHLWFGCAVTSGILDVVFRWQGIQTRKSNLRNWWSWFLECDKRSNNIFLVRLLSLMGVVYFTWKLRNDVIFKGRVIDIEGVGKEVINACKFRMIHKIKTNTRRGRDMMRRLLR